MTFALATTRHNICYGWFSVWLITLHDFEWNSFLFQWNIAVLENNYHKHSVSQHSIWIIINWMFYVWGKNIFRMAKTNNSFQFLNEDWTRIDMLIFNAKNGSLGKNIVQYLFLLMPVLKWCEKNVWNLFFFLKIQLNSLFTQ